MADLTALDNPIWYALTAGHQSMSRSNGLAARYPSDVSPLAALRERSPQAFADLAALVGHEERVALFTVKEVEVPNDWQIIRGRWIDQMICTEVIGNPEMPLLTLGRADVPEMLALTAATQPGPFLPRTIEMGRYYGIRTSEGKLAAMAGERLRLDAFTEVSAVCTDPASRGKGFAMALVTSVAAQILSEGRTAILHVKTENEAKSLYQKIGFSVHQAIRVTAIARK